MIGGACLDAWERRKAAYIRGVEPNEDEEDDAAVGATVEWISRAVQIKWE